MRRGQIFTVDLLLALAVIVLAIGLVTNAWDYHIQQTSSSVEHAKMQQIAIDAAAVEYYKGDNDGGTWLGMYDTVLGQDESAKLLGYELRNDPGGVDCIGSTRGTASKPVEVFVCRGV